MIDTTKTDDPNSQPFDIVRFKVSWWPETLKQHSEEAARRYVEQQKSKEGEDD